MFRICVFTGSRAEYGLLSPLIKKIKNEEEFQLQLLVSGMHLSPEFGLSYKQIEEDGYTIDEKTEMLVSSDSDIGITKSIGLGIISASDAIARLSPDLLIILGDRFEALAVAVAAYVQKIPIAHLHGGETTIGNYDEGFRHAITKMSTFHFASTDLYRRRIIRMGESPNRVFNVGATAIDNIRDMDLLSKEELEKELGIHIRKNSALVTFHPTTLEKDSPEKQLRLLIECLMERDIFAIFTMSNADTFGRALNKIILETVETKPKKCSAFQSLGTLRYLSLVKYVDFVIGNSSSGLVEVPYMRTPTIDLGNRQKGRLKPDSVIECEIEKYSILQSIDRSYTTEFRERINKMEDLFGDGTASKKIVNILKMELGKGIR